MEKFYRELEISKLVNSLPYEEFPCSLNHTLNAAQRHLALKEAFAGYYDEVEEEASLDAARSKTKLRENVKTYHWR